MANVPVSKSSPSVVSRFGVGPSLIGVGVALFVVTRVIDWLPFGFVGSWINGLLMTIVVLSVLAGAGLTYLEAKRSS